MSRRVELEERRVASRVHHGDPYWPPQLAVATAIALNLVLAEGVTVGPTWLLPAVEAVLLAVLVAITPARAREHSKRARRFAIAVIGTVSAVNIASLVLLVRYLVGGGSTGGQALILSGASLWATNVLLFAVWYWELDRGGPVRRFVAPDTRPDLLFPQMDSPSHAPRGWRPGFGDYLYTSLTNATAFSPTDTMPLTHTAKVLMALQSVTALLTLALVVARAVNVLG